MTNLKIGAKELPNLVLGSKVLLFRRFLRGTASWSSSGHVIPRFGLAWLLLLRSVLVLRAVPKIVFLPHSTSTPSVATVMSPPPVSQSKACRSSTPGAGTPSVHTPLPRPPGQEGSSQKVDKSWVVHDHEEYPELAFSKIPFKRSPGKRICGIACFPRQIHSKLFPCLACYP